MSIEDQKQHARQFLTALDKGDEAMLAELIGADFRFELMTSAPGFPAALDRDGFLTNLPKVLKELLPHGMNFTFGVAVSEGPYVSMEGTSETQTSTGRPYTNRYHWYFRFADGKIVEFKEYMVAWQMMQAFAP
ncbi:MAG: hypothetical protein EOP61_40615 [Sphingomonadales bacterium]|nr:MAG: hypothetical protein EOP61_40615 [Sphingomonadales bacterium]